MSLQEASLLERSIQPLPCRHRVHHATTQSKQVAEAEPELRTLELICVHHALSCHCSIQAAVRGWLCRTSLGQILQDAPQTHGLKRAWAAGQLSTVRQALTGLVQEAADDLDQLFAELDASLAVSRGIADPLQVREQAAAAAARAVSSSIGAATGDVDAAAAGQAGANSDRRQLQLQPEQRQHSTPSNNRTLTTSRSSNSSRRAQLAAAADQQRGQLHQTTQQLRRPLAPAAAAGAAAMLRANVAQQARAAAAGQHAVSASSACHNTGTAASASTPAVAVDWDQVISSACQRAETECAICLGPLTAQRETQGVALLSCSHILHVSCVSSFEQFQQGRGCQSSCPVCRAAYTRRCFHVQDGQ
jgi:hypothetical protein